MDQQEQVSLELEEVDMYVLFARMFAHIARKVEQACGEKGIEAVRAGVRSYGEERGRHIAARAAAQGHAADARHYLSCYDMGRSGYFHSRDAVSENQVEQNFDKCVFAETWMRDGCERWGIHYCDIIDPAIAHGYHKEMECIHDRHFFKDGRCHFKFILNQKEVESDD